MNGAVVGSGGEQWLVREAKIAVFDLPPTRGGDANHGDPSDVERTSKREIVSASQAADLAGTTSEVDVDDILAAVPIDPSEPFQLRVSEKLQARAANLSAQLPRASARAIVDAPRPRRAGAFVAPLVAVLAVLAVGGGAGLVAYRTAPISATSAHTFKAATSSKVMTMRASSVTASVPTVHVDSLPRARAGR